ncbi:hypothetical protein PCASD_00269 [Puccinia coronata f. sp. avenae]|uniref:Uncharacterized protein n=1 Tax=Puccinia coronata f. sp. avenae TaxID=200324 RepID=A0A2N5VN52_9BASI|nr:hypothetical protein PCASD_00269 [Puccinia coronata f. sp. avenae]
MGRVSRKSARPLDAFARKRPADASRAPAGRNLASSGRFVLQASVGRSMKASSGRYLTEAPVGRYHKASNRRFHIKTPTGRFQKASSGHFLGRAASGHAVDLQYRSHRPAFIRRQRVIAVIALHFVGQPSTGCFLDASRTVPTGRSSAVLLEVDRETVPRPQNSGESSHRPE